MSRLLVDGDAAVRARSLEFVEAWSDGIDVTAARVAEAGERRLELFGRDVVDGIALRDEYARTASTLSMYQEGRRFAAVLRRLAADGPLGGSAAAVIAEHDPQFVIAQTEAWGAEAGAWANAAAPTFAAYRRDDLLDFLRAAVNLDGATREQVLARVERAIKRDDQAACKSASEQGTGWTAPASADDRRVSRGDRAALTRRV